MSANKTELSKQRWLAHLCLRTGLLQPKGIGYRYMLEMCTEIEVEIGAHRFLTANAQVLIPESFLEEFHGAVSSLEGNFSVLSIENSS